jgi:hypothetical protein
MEENASVDESKSSGSSDEDYDGEVWKDVPEDLFEQDVRFTFLYYDFILYFSFPR